jgi:AraC-like DNA-binding protein
MPDDAVTPSAPPVTRLPHLRFDTARHERLRQFEAWREAVGVTHEITVPGRAEHQGLVASSDVWRMGQAVVSHRRFPTLHFARPVRRARVDGLDQYSLLLMREGMWQGAAGESELTLRPGEVGLFDMARPVANLVTDSSSLRVMLPRDAVDAMVPGGALAAHGARLSGAAASVLATFMEALLQNLPALQLEQAGGMERALVELAAACLAPSRERRERAAESIDASLLLRARAHIEARLGDEGLSPESVALGLGLSRSALYRLFVGLGGVAGYIQARRLGRIKALLADPREGRRISELAYAHGFADEAHFSRAFRRAFGVSAREWRAERGGARRAEGEAPVYQAWVRGVLG